MTLFFFRATSEKAHVESSVMLLKSPLSRDYGFKKLTRCQEKWSGISTDFHSLTANLF